MRHRSDGTLEPHSNFGFTARPRARRVQTRFLAPYRRNRQRLTYAGVFLQRGARTNQPQIQRSGFTTFAGDSTNERLRRSR
jgi:hypothetical protein